MLRMKMKMIPRRVEFTLDVSDIIKFTAMRSTKGGTTKTDSSPRPLHKYELLVQAEDMGSCDVSSRFDFLRWHTAQWVHAAVFYEEAEIKLYYFDARKDR